MRDQSAPVSSPSARSDGTPGEAAPGHGAGSRGVERVGRRRQLLAGAERHKARAAVDGDLKPAGVAGKDGAAEVEKDGEGTVPDGVLRSPFRPKKSPSRRRGPGAWRVVQLEDEVAGAVHGPLGVRQAPLVGEGGAQGGLRGEGPLEVRPLGIRQPRNRQQEDGRNRQGEKSTLVHLLSPLSIIWDIVQKDRSRPGDESQPGLRDVLSRMQSLGA